MKPRQRAKLLERMEPYQIVRPLKVGMLIRHLVTFWI